MLNIFLLFISFTSLASAALLANGTFGYIPSILIGILLTIAVAWCFKIKIVFKPDYILILILLFSLLFRYKPYLYIMGGQDQGTYVNIAHQYLIQKGFYYKDLFRESLNSGQQKIYDQQNPYLMPSIEYWDRGASLYIMKFYPMHPAWVAIFEGLFGQKNAIYSLTLFSLLSISAFYYLAYELSGRKKAPAVIVALLLSINPQHIFFSNFPVGEMVALAFTSWAFYFLVKFIKDMESKTSRCSDLIISCLLFNGYFYTRMSSFMYLPFFFLLGFVFILYIKETKTLRMLLFYLAAVASSFVISYLYYYKFLYSLFYLIYDPTIKELLGSGSDLKFGGLILLFSLLLLLLYRFRSSMFLAKLAGFCSRYAGYVVYLLIAVSVYFSYRAYFTIDIHHSIDLMSNIRNWYTSAGPLDFLKHLPLYTTVSFISPAGLAVFLFAAYYYSKKKDVYILALILFSTMFIAINSIFLRTIRYNYYDTRYIFTESVSYTLLVVGICLGSVSKHSKKLFIAGLTLLLMVVYFTPFSLTLMKGPEMGSLNMYKEITSKVTRNDLLLLYRSGSDVKPEVYFKNFNTFSMGPLKYYFDLNTFILDDPGLINGPEVSSLVKRFPNTYLLSNRELDFSKELTEKTIVRHRYNYYNVAPGCTFHTYEFLPLENVSGVSFPDSVRCIVPPTHYYTRYMDFYLYKVVL